MRNSEKRIDMLPERLCKQCVNIYISITLIKPGENVKMRLINATANE